MFDMCQRASDVMMESTRWTLPRWTPLFGETLTPDTMEVQSTT
jgi:hypothetical protein